MQQPKVLLDKKTVAECLSVSIRTIENLIAAKRLPVRRIGGRTLIPRTALERFARQNHATGPAATRPPRALKTEVTA